MLEIEEFAISHPMLSIGWVSLLIAVLFTTFRDFASKIKMTSYNEAIQLINNDDAIIVDLRQRDDFYNGHIIGSVNLLPNEIKTDNIGELSKYKNKPVIVVDSMGMQARNLASVLNTRGFKKVFVLKDGILGWDRENLPLVRGK